MGFYKKWISVFMALIYLMIGTMLIFGDWNLRGGNKIFNFAFGTLILLYGCFRGFRSYQAFNDDKNE